MPRQRAPRSVYILRDPRTGEVRYCGETSDPARRLVAHLSKARRQVERGQGDAKEAWLVDLLGLGLRPLLSVVERGVPAAERLKAEERWIALFKRASHRLLNKTPAEILAKQKATYRRTMARRAA